MTIFGWLVAAAGFLSLALGWRVETVREILDLALSCLAIAAGIAVVHVSVQALDDFVRVTSAALSRTLGPGVSTGPVVELLALLSDVETGGWQEAFAALRRLQHIGRAPGAQPSEGIEPQDLPREE